MVADRLAFADRIRGMLLLGAYGDALGAQHESANVIAPPPFPSRLPVRPMPEQPEPWGTWISQDSLNNAAGIPSDDSCYRFFLLQPWLAEIAAGESEFTEPSFVNFLVRLRQQAVHPIWAATARNAQIDAWLEMFAAEKNDTPIHFFAPGNPIVFGMFMYGEVAAVIGGPTLGDTFDRYQRFSRLDQSHAGIATGFFAAMIHGAINRVAKSSKESFDQWYLQVAQTLFDQVSRAEDNQSTGTILGNLLQAMFDLGVQTRGQTEHEHATEFHQRVVSPKHPPFMGRPFSGVFDPFRFLAQMTASIAYAENDPFKAIRSVAFTDGDCDTTASLLGLLTGTWFGEQRLRNGQRNKQATEFDADAELALVESNLEGLFQINLDQRVELFDSLRNRRFSIG